MPCQCVESILSRPEGEAEVTFAREIEHNNRFFFSREGGSPLRHVLDFQDLFWLMCGVLGIACPWRRGATKRGKESLVRRDRALVSSPVWFRLEMTDGRHQRARVCPICFGNACVHCNSFICFCGKRCWFRGCGGLGLPLGARTKIAVQRAFHSALLLFSAKAGKGVKCAEKETHQRFVTPRDYYF